jgi:hypothetical protein
MKRCLITMCFGLLAVSAALAQEKKTVPPPPNPADDGPSLEATMKFIQDTMNDNGPVNYAIYFHDNAVGNEWTNQYKIEGTNFTADPGSCRLSYHWKAEKNRAVVSDVDVAFFLKTLVDIVAMPMEQNQKEVDTANGHPSWSYRVDPPAFVAEVRKTGRGRNAFDFSDEQMANRVAKAMAHAVELCGGGSQSDPF